MSNLKNNSVKNVKTISRYASRSVYEAVEDLLKKSKEHYTAKEIANKTGKELRQTQNALNKLETQKNVERDYNSYPHIKYGWNFGKDRKKTAKTTSKALKVLVKKQIKNPKVIKKKIKKVLLELIRQEAYDNSEDEQEEKDIFKSLLYEPNLLENLKDKDFINKIALRSYGSAPNEDFIDKLYAVIKEIMIPEGVQIEGEFTPKQKKEERERYKKMGMKAEFIEY